MIQALHHDEFLVLHPALTTFSYILTLTYLTKLLFHLKIFLHILPNSDQFVRSEERRVGKVG